MNRATVLEMLQYHGYQIETGYVRPQALPWEIILVPDYDRGYTDKPALGREPKEIGEAKGEQESLATCGYFLLGIPVTVPGISNAPKSINFRVKNWNTETESWTIDGAYPESYREEDLCWPPGGQQPTKAQALFLFSLLPTLEPADKSWSLDAVQCETVWEGDIPNPTLEDPQGTLHVVKGRVTVQKFGPLRNEWDLPIVTDHRLSVLKVGNSLRIGEIR